MGSLPGFMDFGYPGIIIIRKQ